MRQLTSLDAQFLALENARQTGHVAGLAIYDTSTTATGGLTCADMKQLISDRLHLLPPLRWRLVEVPLGADYPYWVDDTDFDLDFHVRELALAPPGDERQLAEQVARLHARSLDRARPLWELYVISGLRDGHVAVYTKIHHAVIDGVSGAEITGMLLDLSPEIRQVEAEDLPDAAGRRPGQAELLARALLGLPRYPLRVLRSLPSALPNLEETQFSAIPGAGRLGRTLGQVQRLVSGDPNRAIRSELKAPKTSFNGRISPHRRFAFGQLDLDRVKALKTAYGVTVNDVVVTICAGAVRRWLLDHDELPEEPLVTQVPVSVRSTEQAGTYGNRILMLGAPLFTNIADPAERLRRTHDELKVMKDRHRAMPADLLQDVNHFIPPALFSRAARATFRLATSSAGRPQWNLVISNVPGPQFPLYCAGARLVAHYPVSVITDGMGLNITAMSYDGHIDVGIIADRDQVADVWCLVDYLNDSIAELEKAASTLEL
ncbi:MAG TPA: wax ester/triacylglycerol synthase family O-acyltransferase [Mycobacteriales bacterium]|nr:wax ester/triacylglycerol synthase family O-acyltransferase [Mycobacteriales bacterium]